MYRNFSSVYRRRFGYTSAYDVDDAWNSWYRPRWRYNFARPDYSYNSNLWDPLRWVDDDVESSPETPTGLPSQPSPGSTPHPSREPTPQPRSGSTPHPSQEPTPQPRSGSTPHPSREPTPQPRSGSTPHPSREPTPRSGSTPHPSREPTPQPTSGSTPQPASGSPPEPTSGSAPQPTSDSPLPPSRSTRQPDSDVRTSPEQPSDPVITPPPKPEKPSGEPTEILGVDLLPESNRVSHYTTAYVRDGLIVRRGQAFEIEVSVNKQWNEEDTLRIQLSIGKRPHLSYGTLHLISPTPEHSLRQASAVIKDIENTNNGATIRLSVSLPCDCPVGEYTLVIIARKKEDEGKKFTKFLVADKIIVLFNPWCKDDDVYLENEDERSEYVLNESGRIFTSRSLWHKGKPWTFGQFQESVLDAALYLLNKTRLPSQAHGNPIRVTRHLSALVNSNDEAGVLSGNWSGDYSGGTSPTSWTGSVRILHEYMETKSPVKWAQCWVFSGVLTSVCRALGIPTRSVTNFESAHDSDESMTIDTFYDEDGNPLKYLNDSVWNFHVWNEAWFLRPDLPGNYGGWQAFDSTPQERSEYIFQCGPASLKAIKEGNVHLGYDAKFIFAEVNGDQITWTKHKDGTLKPTSRLTRDVGKAISTKEVLKPDRNIITHLYKHKEGSDKERESVARAYQLSNRRRDLDAFFEYSQNDDVTMTFEPEMNDDATARFLLTAKNNSSETRTVSGTFTIVAAYYTGITANQLDKARTHLTIKPGEEKEFSWHMAAKKWINKAAEDATVGIYAYVKVKETGQVFVKKILLELSKPELEMTFDKTTTRRGEGVVLTMKFTNPMDLELKRCSVTVEGTGFKPIKESVSNVEANSVMSASVELVPLMSGRLDVTAAFHSRQLVNISGSATFTVED